jgi:NAD+-processing family protein with receiver domain
VMSVLWLDDLRPPGKHGYVGAYWVKTAAEAIKLFKKGRIRFASLDHDLSVEATMGIPVEGEETGYTVVCWLEEHPEFWPVDGVRAHSLNSVGKAKMQVVIRKQYGRVFE